MIDLLWLRHSGYPVCLTDCNCWLFHHEATTDPYFSSFLEICINTLKRSKSLRQSSVFQASLPMNFHLLTVFNSKRYLRHLIKTFLVFFLHSASLNTILFPPVVEGITTCLDTWLLVNLVGWHNYPDFPNYLPFHDSLMHKGCRHQFWSCHCWHSALLETPGADGCGHPPPLL